MAFGRAPLPAIATNANVVNVGNNVVNVGNGSDRDGVADAILSFISANQTITLKELAEELRLSERQVQRIMKKMREDGIVVREGGTRGRWVVP